MVKPTEASPGADAPFGALFSAAQDGQTQMLESWGQACEAYARYFGELAKARGPEDLWAANTQLALAAMDALPLRPVGARPNGADAVKG